MKTALFFSKIALFTLLLPLALHLGAQESTYQPVPVEISHTLDTVAGKIYFVHTVQRGHTLYSICRAYQTTAEALLKDSPESQVQADEFIYIPFTPTLWPNNTQPERFAGKRPWVVLALQPQPEGNKTADETQPLLSDTPETASKAQQRRERREERAAAKAEEQADLQNEESESSEADEAQMILNDSSAPILELQEKAAKDTLRISLLLPLYSNAPHDPKAYVYLPFFEGVSVAWQTMLDPGFFTPAADTTFSLADSLAMENVPLPEADLKPENESLAVTDSMSGPSEKLPFLQLRLFDLTQSVESVDEILADEYFLHSDAIIATAFVDHFLRLDSVSRLTGIPLIHPVSERDSLCAGNPYLIQLAASYATQLNQLAEFVQRKSAKARILIISDSSQSEVAKADYLSNLIYNSERLYFNTATAEMLEALAEENKQPLVILPFYRKEISAVKTVLPLRQNKGNITIIAPAVWLDYSTIDLDYFIQNHLTVYSTFFGIHQNPDFMDFSKKYYFLYRGLPNTLAYQGYCVTRWLIDMLQTFNADFMRHIDTENADRISRSFYHFEKREIGGFENRNIQFIKVAEDGIERLEFKPFKRPEFSNEEM